jgi:hypothetical protein
MATLSHSIPNGKIMDIPNSSNTFNILEERKNYLIIKNQKNNDKNGYIQAEITALDRIINFSKLIIDNFQDDLIENLIKKYEMESIENNQLDEKKEYKIIYSYEKEITKIYKINISFIERSDREKHILIEPKKYIKSNYKWEKRGKINLPIKIMEEIIKKTKEIEKESRRGKPILKIV